MDRREQAALAAQLHAQLISHMGAISRLSLLATGTPIDPLTMLGWMEQALMVETARIGTEPSVYSAEQLRIRQRIAAGVVAAIRREVGRSQ